jgi:hypothetical protein
MEILSAVGRGMIFASDFVFPECLEPSYRRTVFTCTFLQYRQIDGRKAVRQVPPRGSAGVSPRSPSAGKAIGCATKAS